MCDYLTWIAEKFIEDNFDETNPELFDDVMELILNHAKNLKAKYDPDIYVRETQELD